MRFCFYGQEVKTIRVWSNAWKNVTEAIDSDSLSCDEKRRALNAVNLIKLKRDGTIKAQTCANGSTQRNYIPKKKLQAQL